MTKGALTKSSRGAVATGATAAGAASLGALAVGAVALAAVAVGALAVGRLTVGRARLRRMEIDELTVGRLEVGADASGGTLTAVARIRAVPGMGHALARLLAEEARGSAPGCLLGRAHRSPSDPDAFLFCETYADEAGFDAYAQAAQLEALLLRAVEEGLVVASGDAPVEVVLYRRVYLRARPTAIAP